ncbi:PLP-dependent cysteine synthase family protein [Anaerobium acetethylicum]|uniref:cysteine synthase n=1 Tax=Anaerobium acetethylicum TaxID=1619234 RepID=A0A1D3TU61_9FIRM|nr:cysteine synthase family protein [Anaerobium acetethylicum]SCP97561.1 cysteine synthase A [Anaerobium acetethylicum]
MEKIRQQLAGLKAMVGNTPLMEISFEYKGEDRKLYAKAEHYSITGSAKDRVAINILEKAYNSGELKKESIIVEATSGNMGISFSAIGRLLGHRVIIFMPDWMSQERVELMKSFGAEIRLVSREEGGFLGCIRKSEEYRDQHENVFLPRQFANEDNAEAHYLTTGNEIWRQMQERNIVPEAVVAGVGTGGSIMGIGRYLKEQNPKMKIHPLEPASSPTLSTGYKTGKHRIQGISDEFVPAILKLDEIDEVVAVEDGDSIIMAQMLSRELGMGVGVSSGANFLGAIKVQEMLGGRGTVVILFPDDNKKYLSTDLMGEEPEQEGYISNDVKLKGFNAFR